MFRICTGLVLTLTIVPAVFAGHPVVEANNERLEGRWTDASETIAVFKGIPFAAPPVGGLRWRMPRPNKPRKGLQSAAEFAPACMQDAHIIDWYADLAAGFGAGPGETARPTSISEDCLYLNIWSPSLDPAAKLPVMVWFHGGSNKAGWSYEPNYSGAGLAAKGVVLVTMGYRVGPFGFFAHPELKPTPEEPAVANFGWLDQNAALEWIQEHIVAFGGDSGNVTAIGESSGAGDLANLLGTDIATGLIHRAIAQSPGSNLVKRRTLRAEQDVGWRLAEALGMTNDERTMDELRNVPAERILAAAEQLLPGHYYEVVIDDVTFKRSPLETLRKQRDINIDLLIGTNRDEWLMYYPDDIDWDDVEDWLDSVAPDAAEALLVQVADETDPRRALDRLETAYRMLCPNRRAAARITAAGGRVWFYRFTRQRRGAARVGAYHGAEIPYVFNTHDDWLPTNETDRKLTEIIMDYWVQFARTGDPNVPGRPQWPEFNMAEPRVMELGDEVRAIQPVDAALCLWLGPE